MVMAVIGGGGHLPFESDYTPLVTAENLSESSILSSCGANIPNTVGPKECENVI